MIMSLEIQQMVSSSYLSIFQIQLKLQIVLAKFAMIMLIM